MKRASIIRIAVVATAFGVTLGGASAWPAHAAFPGHNGKIAYVRLSNHQTDIYTMRGDGSHKRRVARDATVPAFSPIGKKIVFARLGRQRGDLYLMRADGSHKRRLTHARRSEFSPAFSPSGKRIVFEELGVRGGAFTSDLYTIRVDGTHRERLTTGTAGTTGLAIAPQFSPNGRRIAFGRACHIAIMRADGSDEHPLTAPVGETCDEVPDFSPDGHKIAFAQNARQIFTMNTTGSELTPLPTPNRAHNDNPAFSPRGQKIAFDSDRRQGAGDTEIYKMSRSGTHVKRLTYGRHAVAYAPSWGVRPR